MLKQPGDMILLVEDDDATIMLAQQAVASCTGDMRLVAVRDTVEALEWLSDNAERGYPMPRLILLDLKLPKLAGLAVLRTLRLDERMQEVPVVVFSERHEPSDVVLSYQVGANSFISKPSDLSEFTRQLQDLLGPARLGVRGMSPQYQPLARA